MIIYITCMSIQSYVIALTSLKMVLGIVVNMVHGDALHNPTLALQYKQQKYLSAYLKLDEVQLY